MKNEKITVASNYDGSSEGGIEHQGVEVSIGCFTSDKSEHLKLLLQNDNLFEERTGPRGNAFIGSSFLNDLMDVNENYHKNGLITYENEINNDIENLSTDNWCFSGDYNKKASSMVVFDGEDRGLKQEVQKYDDATGEWITTMEDSTSTRSTLKIPKEGFIKMSVRSESLYFYAGGILPVDKKSVLEDYSDPKFEVQPGVDTIFPGSGFCDFDILHSVFVDGEELGRNFEEEDFGGGVLYSSHLLFKDGIVVAWLATNNNAHFWPFGDEYTETSLPCISPYLKENNPETYEAAVKILLEKL
jgi:hypothetical protein